VTRVATELEASLGLGAVRGRSGFARKVHVAEVRGRIRSEATVESFIDELQLCAAEGTFDALRLKPESRNSIHAQQICGMDGRKSVVAAKQMPAAHTAQMV